jgi:aryl-alcohol dehydrogenase-like predicted oxidoreductase
MQKRRFGRTGHMSTLAIFGAAAFWDVTQEQADRVMQMVIDAGINHFDVAPSYGKAEQVIGPWMPKERNRFFLGCKTTERTAEGATAEMHRSLERLQVSSFDLYQIHAVTSFEELDKATQKGGALEAIIKAKEEGLTRFIGITGHGDSAPAIYIEALRRFDFDTVLFPLNFIQYANPQWRRDSEELLAMCAERNVGTMIIKSVTRSPWGDRPHTATTWYEPFKDREMIQKAVNFALSQNITGLCTLGDIDVLPTQLEAIEAFTPMDTAEQEALIATASQYAPLFA